MALAGCGDDDSGDDNSSSATDTTATTSSADLTAYKGIYVADLSAAELRKNGASEGDFPGGTWRLSIASTAPNNIRVEPGGFDLEAVSVDNGQVTFAPDTTCPSVEGRTQQSIFKIEKTPTGIRFVAVKPSCKSDAAPLTLGDWRGV